MKKSLIIVFALVLLSATKLALSQDTSIVNYLPLSVGNIWVYNFSASCYAAGYGNGYHRYAITSAAVLNGKKYYLFQHTLVFTGGSYSGYGVCTFQNTYPIRIDSITGNIYKLQTCGSSPESLIDSLKAKIGDTTITCNHYCYGFASMCYDTSLYNIFSADRQCKKFGTGGFEGGSDNFYVRNIGIVRSESIIPFCSDESTLKGCVINSVLYGDTSILVGINQISSEVPQKFSLSQNFPNPFNPITKIKFDIPSYNKGLMNQTPTIKLIIYDALGKEVTTLVNQQLNPGSYDVDWDGTNYPSGVYFYQLSIGNEQLATKKMVLIK